MEREQAQSHESKDIPTAKPLDFEVTLPDMSKVSRKCAAEWCSPHQSDQHTPKLHSGKARSVQTSLVCLCRLFLASFWEEELGPGCTL